MKYFAVPTTNWGDVMVPDVKPDPEILQWADMISDRLRMDELCGLLMAFRILSYERGYLAGRETYRSESKEPTSREEGGARAAGDAGEVQGVSGRMREGTPRFRGYETEVAEGNRD